MISPRRKRAGEIVLAQQHLTAQPVCESYEPAVIRQSYYFDYVGPLHSCQFPNSSPARKFAMRDRKGIKSRASFVRRRAGLKPRAG